MGEFSKTKGAQAFAAAKAFGEMVPAPKTDLTCGFIAEAEKFGWKRMAAGMKPDDHEQRSRRARAARRVRTVKTAA